MTKLHILFGFSALLDTQFHFFFRSILISNRPIAVQISSRNRTSNATKIPALVVRPKAETDIMNPPSRPPSCRGIKKSILANNVVNAMTKTQSTNCTLGNNTKRINMTSNAEHTRHASSSNTTLTNVRGF